MWTLHFKPGTQSHTQRKHCENAGIAHDSTAKDKHPHPEGNPIDGMH